MPTPSRFYSNVAVANTLGASLSNAATTMFTSTTPVGYPTQFPFTLCLDAGTGSQELVSVTGGAGTAGTPWTITRGFDGTTAVAHNATTGTVSHQFSASDAATSRAHEASGSGSGVHGLPSSAWSTAPLAVINETILSNSTTATQTWSSIPAVYAHLLIVVQGRLTDTSLLTNWVGVQFNGDTGSNYSYLSMASTTLSGTLNAPFSFTSFGMTYIPLFRMAASQGGTAANAGGGWAIVPNYSGSTFNKAAYSMTGAGNGTSSMIDGELSWGFYNPASQAAISSVSVSALNSAFFKTGTFLGLYGLGA